MKEKAVVIGMTGKEVLVRTIPGEQCSGCCSCGASKGRSFKVPAGEKDVFHPGDRIEIEVDPGSMLKVYTIVYALPLAVFVVFLAGSYAITVSPIWSFAAACAALGLVYVVTAFYVRKVPSILPVARLSKRTG